MPKKKKNNGCLWIFTFGVLTLFCWIFLLESLDFSPIISTITSLLLGIFFTYRWLGKPSIKNSIYTAGFLIAVLIGIKVLATLFSDTINIVSESKKFKTKEKVTQNFILENNDSIAVYESHRIWKDNYGNNYNGTLTIRQKDYLTLKEHIRDFRPASGGNFWGKLYRYIDKNDTPKLDLVINALQEINQKKQLNQMEFAEMVVSCIQDIPYSFVFQDECLPAESYEPSIRRILEECPSCCMGNVPYGIQNPLSFLQNLKGDCDTRTVLIYSILKYFKYDVAILNSNFYRHSIIGINLPTQGEYKLHKGKKYVVWETTAKYFEVGKLPYNFSDITHWEVVLTSK